MTTLYEALCGDAFSTQHDANSHEWHCDQCAGVLDSIERMLDSSEALEAELDALEPVYTAALPKNAPGAWIRAALEAKFNSTTD